MENGEQVVVAWCGGLGAARRCLAFDVASAMAARWQGLSAAVLDLVAVASGDLG